VRRVAKGTAVELKRMPTPTDVPTVADLYLPPLVGKLAEKKVGLVLVTGIGRSGRSRTIAAMVDHVNRTYAKRIVTLEEPILYLHRRQQSVVEQRQVALDVPDFSSGLDQALQDTPEVLAVSEFLDAQTVATALAAAEHSLIVGRVMSGNPREAIQKLVSLFPPREQPRIRSRLIANLAGVVWLTRLDPASGEVPVPGAAVLVVDGTVRAALANDALLETVNERFEVTSANSWSLGSSVELLHKDGKITEAMFVKYRTQAAGGKATAAAFRAGSSRAPIARSRVSGR
jgi:twitching motility protein PilT